MVKPRFAALVGFRRTNHLMLAWFDYGQTAKPQKGGGPSQAETAPEWMKGQNSLAKEPSARYMRATTSKKTYTK
jgi:hypothetical protein